MAVDTVVDLEKGIQQQEAMGVPAMDGGGEKEPMVPDLRHLLPTKNRMAAATVGTGAPPVPRLPLPVSDRLVDTGDEDPRCRLVVMKNCLTIEKAIEDERSPVPVGDIEMENFRTAPAVENGTSSTATASKERKHFDLKVSALLITVSMIPLIDLLFLHGPTAKLNLTLKLSVFVAFTAFISAVCLMLHTFKLMAIKPDQLIPKSQLRASKILFTIGVSSLVLTSISITYSLLPKAYYFLPLALLPSLLVGGFHFLYGSDTDSKGEIISPEESKARKKELKRATQLSLSLASTSFSGFIGCLLAIYHKAAILGAAYSYVKVSIYLLLGGGIVGAFALLLCRILPNNAAGTTWQRAILAAANVVMVVMLVPAVLVIAETILHGLLVGTVFPVLTGAVAWLLVEFCTAAGADDGCTDTEDGKAAHGTMYAIAVVVASVSFGAIIALFAGLLGGAVGKEQLKACTFLLASAFVAAVSLGLVMMCMMPRAEKTKASTAFSATVLTCCGLSTLVLAALALFYQIAA